VYLQEPLRPRFGVAAQRMISSLIFVAEFGFHESLPTIRGTGHSRRRSLQSRERLCLAFVGIGCCTARGYFHQT